MTGHVGSAVVSEITSRTITKVLEIFDKQPAVDEKLHKLEMLRIKINGIVEASEKHRITGKYLLQWQEKLKEAATDADEAISALKSRNTNHQMEIGTHDTLTYTKNATSSMVNYFHNAAKMLLSCDEGVQKLNSTLERLEKLSADTDDFMRLVDLEEAWRTEEHACAKGKKPMVICHSPSLPKEEHQRTNRKRALDSTKMLRNVKREAPIRSLSLWIV